MALAVAAFALLLVSSFREDASSKIASDLKEASKTGSAERFLSDFELVCFNFNNANTREEFAMEAVRLNKRFLNAVRSCGTGNSCCNLDSDTSGVIGLVREDEIRCVEVMDFKFMTPRARGMCINPAELSVTNKIFSARTNPPGRAWIAHPGDAYFEITSRAPR